LHGRPETTSDEVFLRVRPPFRAFSNGVVIGDMFDYYRKRAGLPRDAYDGKGFPALGTFDLMYQVQECSKNQAAAKNNSQNCGKRVDI